MIKMLLFALSISALYFAALNFMAYQQNGRTESLIVSFFNAVVSLSTLGWGVYFLMQ